MLLLAVLVKVAYPILGINREAFVQEQPDTIRLQVLTCCMEE